MFGAGTQLFRLCFASAISLAEGGWLVPNRRLILIAWGMYSTVWRCSRLVIHPNREESRFGDRVRSRKARMQVPARQPRKIRRAVPGSLPLIATVVEIPKAPRNTTSELASIGPTSRPGFESIFLPDMASLCLRLLQFQVYGLVWFLPEFLSRREANSKTEQDADDFSVMNTRLRGILTKRFQKLILESLFKS